MNHEFNSMCRRKKHPYSTKIHWSDQGYLHKSGSCCKKNVKNILVCGRESEKEIEELRRICCEETDRARPLRIENCLCNKRRIIQLWLSSWLKFRIHRTRRIPCLMQENFYDPDTATTGASHVPSQPLIIPSPWGMLRRDSGLPLDTRNTVGTSGNVFESLPAGERPSSAPFENSWN